MHPSRAQSQVFSCKGSAVWVRWVGSEVGGGDAGEDGEVEGVGGRWSGVGLEEAGSVVVVLVGSCDGW